MVSIRNKVYHKKYYKKNRKRKIAYSTGYKEKHGERIKQYMKDYRQAHREEFNERDRLYNLAHKRWKKKYNHDYFKTHKEIISKRYKAWCKTNEQKIKECRKRKWMELSKKQKEMINLYYRRRYARLQDERLGIECIFCGSKNYTRWGIRRSKRKVNQKYKCNDCKRYFVKKKDRWIQDPALKKKVLAMDGSSRAVMMKTGAQVSYRTVSRWRMTP